MNPLPLHGASAPDDVSAPSQFDPWTRAFAAAGFALMLIVAGIQGVSYIVGSNGSTGMSTTTLNVRFDDAEKANAQHFRVIEESLGAIETEVASLPAKSAEIDSLSKHDVQVDTDIASDETRLGSLERDDYQTRVDLNRLRSDVDGMMHDSRAGVRTPR